MRSDLYVFAVYLLAGIGVTAHLWRDPNHRATIINHADPVLFEWALAHAAHAVIHAQNPLFAPEQNVPDGVNAMANTTLLGVGLPLVPVTVLFGPSVSYVLALTIGLSATAATTYWVFSRHLVDSRLAAFAGGALFGFAPGVIWHAYGQLHLVTNFLLPPIVALALRLGAPGTVRRGLLLGVLVAWQVMISPELLLVAAVGVLLCIMAAVAVYRHPILQLARRFGAGLGVAALTAAVLLAYPLWFMFFGPQHYHGVLNVFRTWGEDLAAYVAVGPFSLGHTVTPWYREQNSLLGWPLVAVCVVAAIVLWRRIPAVRVASLTAAGAFLLAAGPRFVLRGHITRIPGPFALLSGRPLFDLVLPTRFAIIVVAAATVVTALVIDELVRTLAGPPRVLAVAAVGAALLPLCPLPLQVESVPPIPPFIADGTWRHYVPAGRTLVPVPLPSNQDAGLAGLRWSALTRNDMAIPRGYFIGPDRTGHGMFGAIPSHTSELLTQVGSTGTVPTITAADRAAARTDLQRWRAAVVVLAPATRNATALRTTTTNLLGSPPMWIDGVWLWTVPAT